MKQPTVSIVMPTYNSAKFIKESIQSVIDQSFSDWELIVVSDGCTDDTKIIVESFKDSRIRYFYREHSGCPAIPRNYAIKQSQGRYIAFLDSDDVWLPSKLSKQVEAFKKDTQLGLCFSLFSVLSEGDDNGRTMGPKRSIDSSDVYRKLLKVNFIINSSVMLRKDILDTVGLFDESYDIRFAEDYDLWLRISVDYKVIFIEEVLGSYRKHSNNNSEFESPIDRILKVIENHHKKHAFSDKDLHNIKASQYSNVGWSLMSRDAVLARQYFLDAIKIKSGDFKIYFTNILGVFLSYIPAFFMFLRRNAIGQKIKRVFLN